MHDTIIEIDTRESVRVIKVRSEIDIANAAVLQRYLDEASPGAGSLIVSLQECNYMDSTGLRPIMRLADRIGDGFYIVVPPKTQIRRIFELTHLDEQMHVCDTLEAALSQAGAKALSA